MVEDEAIEFFDAHVKQREPAEALGEAFDITRAKDRDNFSFWIAKPHDHTAERFGLKQEILVLYSSFQETDARVITAIEGVLGDRTYRNRLDRVLVLLIHNGDEAKTADLVRTSTDRVIVPLIADQLRDPARGNLFLRSQIAARFGSTDLFGMSSPITSDRYFFGRDPLVHELSARSLVHGENSGLFGLRKTGKTSVLFALRRQLPADDVRIAYLDCQSPGTHAARWWQVLEEIVCRLRGGEPTHSYNPESASAAFGEAIRSLLHDESNRAVVMLDEVEYITYGISGALGSHWDEDFVPLWQTIRAAHQESQGRLTFIVAGVNPVSVERPHFGSVPNPIFQLAVPQYLDPLDVDSVRRMVRTIGRYAGLSFDEDVYPYLQFRYGGHPYLIRVACSELWRATDTLNPEAKHQVKVKDFERLDRTLKGRLAQPIKDILVSLVWWYPEEYDLLQILAAGDALFVSEYLTAKPESLVQFARYGILRERTAEFAISDVRDFLRDNGDSYKKELSPFRRGDIPPDLLPAVPDLVTLAELFEKRTQVEMLLRRAIVLYLGVRHSWDEHRISKAMIGALRNRPDGTSPAEIFVGRRPQDAVNELYTPDLKLLVLANWDLFAPLFESRQRFEMNLDTMNVARRTDAHSKPFSSAERADFTNSYGWLLARLSKLPSQ